MKLSALALLLFAAVAPPPEQRYFRYERAVQVPSNAGTQTCVPLDAAVFEHASRGHADLRLYLGDKEVPFSIVVAAAPSLGPQLVLPLNKGVREGRTEFDAAMPPGTYGDVELQISRQNFQAKVEVSGSDTATGSGARAVGRYTIFDLREERSGRSTVLHLPSSDFRYLHFAIDGPIKPEDIAGITVPSPSDAPDPPYTTVARSSAAQGADHTTTFAFTVPKRVPVDRVFFDPGAEPAYFRRNVKVTVVSLSPEQEEDSGEAGPKIYNGTLLRLEKVENGDLYKQENDSVPVPTQMVETPHRWTVSVNNGDDQPLQLRTVQLQMLQRELCFAPAGAAGYVLRYGDGALSEPQYDYSSQFARRGDAAGATLGPERESPGWQQRPDARAFTERHPVLLWIALIAVMVLLGSVALRSRSRRD